MNKKGFTIVELLIVIVVIAILAAITIVAYNGIQNRAKSTSLQSASSQAGKKVLAFAPLNTDLYPQETSFRTDLSIPANTDEATYDYYVSDDRKSFCISVTNTKTNPVTSYAYTQNGQNVEGRCIKNLATNPSVEIAVAPYGGVNGTSPVRQASSAISGSFGLGLSCSANNISDCGLNLSPAGVIVSGKVYTYSYLIRGVTAGSYNTYLANNAGNTAVRPIVTLTTNQTGRISLTQTSTGSGAITWYGLRGSGAAVSTFDIDGIMITEGDALYVYSDPITNPNTWSWTGTANASPSFGPAKIES